jgi:hypothetical protein
MTTLPGIGALAEKQREADKEAHAKWACMVWIASGLYLFLSTAGASLLSWPALAFFVPGLFFAALTVGVGGYMAQRALAAGLVATGIGGQSGVPGPATTAVVSLLGLVLFIMETAVGYHVAKEVFLWLGKFG